MATLADINNELSMQGNVLEDTRDSIASVASTVRKQFDFFTNRELKDLETSREARPTTPAVNVSSAEGQAGFGNFLKGGGLVGLAAGVTEFLLNAGRFILRNALKAIRVGAGVLFFPFIKNFADDISKELIDFSSEILDKVFDFEMTNEQKETIRQAISSGLTTSIVGLLFGLGARRSLIAGLIAAGFTSLLKAFPNLEGDTIEYLRSIGLGEYADMIENNPETVKTAIALGLSFLAPAIVSLGFRMISGILTGLATAIGGVPLAIAAGVITVAGFTYKYYTDGEFRRKIDEALAPIREAMFSKAREIEDFVLNSLRSMRERLVNFIFGIDNDAFNNDPRQLQIQELENQLVAARQAKEDAFMAAETRSARQKIIYDADDAFQIAALSKQIADLRKEIRSDLKSGTGPTTVLEEPLLQPGVPDYLARTGKVFSATDIEEANAAITQREYMTPQSSSYFGDINSGNTTTTVNQSTNIMGITGNTQSSWEVDEEIARRSGKLFN